METPYVVQVGAARVTLLNSGDLQFRLADELATPEELWRPQYADIFENMKPYPSLSVLIQLYGVTTLVDANDYAAMMTPDNEYTIPGYTPPPPVVAQLASVGVAPEDVEHLVITHTHWDHFAGLTQIVDGAPVPVYPRARVYLAQADWEDTETQAGLANPDSVETRTLGALKASGKLELLTGDWAVAPGVAIVSAPGETPRHQTVRIQSNGETAYILGDLIHHPLEVEHPDWMVTWANPETMLASRKRMFDNALAANALLTAAHIPNFGRLQQDADGIHWIEEA